MEANRKQPHIYKERGYVIIDVTPCFYLVPKEGLEPTRPEGHSVLNAARLPIPPLRHFVGQEQSNFRLHQPIADANLPLHRFCVKKTEQESGGPGEREQDLSSAYFLSLWNRALSRISFAF